MSNTLIEERATPTIKINELDRTGIKEKSEVISEFKLHSCTSRAWLDCVIQHFDLFLLDHAACEKKASSMAMSLISHYPDKPELVRCMALLAVEELVHFREVVSLIQERGLELAPDTKDPYISGLRAHIKRGKDQYLMDQLLLAAVVEARGHERFSMIAESVHDQKLQKFYHSISVSEARHYEVFLNLAMLYFSPTLISPRLKEWLLIESEVIQSLPIHAALH